MKVSLTWKKVEVKVEISGICFLEKLFSIKSYKSFDVNLKQEK